MKIAQKLAIIVMGGSILASAAIGIVSYRIAANELQTAAAKTLVALREARAAEFQRYLNSIQGDLDLLVSNQQVKDALKDFTAAFTEFGIFRKRTESMLKQTYNTDTPKGDEERLGPKAIPLIAKYDEAHRRYDPWFRLLQEVRGYYDIFLLNSSGDVVYTVAKESDFATNLFVGEWRQTGLAKTLDGALSTPPNIRKQFVDFEPYEPSNLLPASFISAPVKEGEKVIGVLAFQMPIDRINEVMQVTSGMGETGETYVVGKDFLMRTDSRFSRESTILKTTVATSSAQKALAGESGVNVIPDYRNISVLSAYGPMEFAGAHWAILSEIDMDEVLSPILQMRNFLLSIGALITGAVVAVGLMSARSISVPLMALSATFSSFGRDRQKTDVPYKGRRDEIGDMARNFEKLTTDITTYIDKQKEAEEEIADKNDLLEALSSKLAKYLSPQVYQSIFSGEQDVTISTNRKKLTVFFSDIKDFTATTEDLEPEELTFLLNDYLTNMTEIALEYGATIDKYVGDAMLLFFGDPTTEGVKEDALACVKMAITMQQRMVDLRAKWRDLGHQRPLQMRIGINTGYCNVGNFGSDERMDYTIIGGEVNLAARLESISDPDGIMLAYETYSLVKDEAQAEEQDPIQVKGITRKVVPYKVTGIYDNLDENRAYIRSDNGAMRLYVDLRKLNKNDRIATAIELEDRARQIREISD